MIILISWIVTIFITVFSIFYVYAKYKLSYWQRRGIKSPPTHLIFGNLKECFTFKKPPGEVLQNIYESADPDDPYIGFYAFHKPMLLLRNIELIKRVLVNDFNIFPNRNFGGKMEIDSIGLVNLLGIRQTHWKYLRNKITPLLAGHKFKNMVPLMQDCGVPFLAYLDNAKEGKDGWKEIELKIASSKYASDVMSSLFFGITTDSFNIKDIAFWNAGQKIISGMWRTIILLLMFFIPDIQVYIIHLMTKPANFFRKIFSDSITTREKLNIKRSDLMDSFITLKNEEQNPNFKFDNESLMAQAVGLYEAGFEGISGAIAFSLYELAQYPELQQRAYEEIEKVVVKQELDLEILNEMSFLEQVINEALRMYPPLPIINRIAVSDYRMPEYNLKIEKDIAVYVCLPGINKDPKYVTNPTKFNPMRIQDEKNESQFTSFNFGYGPRSCVGKKLAHLIAKVCLIQILKNYEVYREKEKCVPLDPINFFTNTADGVRVWFKKRNDS